MQGRIRSFASDESGAVAGIYAVALIGLIAIGGVGFDYARMAGMDSELQNAADQAALAAATQLDGNDTACARAGDAAINLLSNITLLSNDGTGNAVTVNAGAAAATGSNQCGDRSYITFYSAYTDPATNTLASTDADAGIVEVSVDSRTARYAFTPIVGAIFSTMSARAVASIGSAICDVPPLMICDPDPGNATPIANRLLPGTGIQVTGHGNNATKTGGNKDDYNVDGSVSHWAPGDFGFLEIGTGNKNDLVRALAYKDLPFDCTPVGGTKPETGNAQGLYDALNTRFDIYDFANNSSAGSGNPLSACNSGACPAATNTTKDVVKSSSATNGNACKLHNSGWELPDEDEQFWPIAANGSYDGMSTYNNNTHTPAITAMGHPRDLCHYASYRAATASNCGTDANNRVGNGNWARGDYFRKNHPGKTLPSNKATITRYQTYLWENGAGGTPGTSVGQRGPVCSQSRGGGETADRRVLTVAVVTNCASLSGSSTAVNIGEWLDMFLVEPIVDERANGSVKDGLYMEVIRVNDLGAGSSTGGTVRKDKPFLIE